MGIPDRSMSSKETISLTPFGDACSRRDLTAVHEILDKVGYKDDEDVANEVIHRFYFFLYLDFYSESISFCLHNFETCLMSDLLFENLV